VFLSVKAGLRAGEIANLTWEMVLEPDGDVGPAIELRDWAAKKSSGRLIPINPKLREALIAWLPSPGQPGQ
jgi:integrase